MEIAAMTIATDSIEIAQFLIVRMRRRWRRSRIGTISRGLRGRDNMSLFIASGLPEQGCRVSAVGYRALQAQAYCLPDSRHPTPHFRYPTSMSGLSFHEVAKRYGDVSVIENLNLDVHN